MKQRVYVRKHKTGPENCDEWVVRVELPHGDFAICGSSGRWEADFVKQCVMEAMASKVKSVRLEKLIAELKETF